MLQSLYSAVSGLQANQTEMGVIGNNIANSNSTGFKSSDAQFVESFDQYSRVASANAPVGTFTGLGTRVDSTVTNFSQGTVQPTNVPTDMALNGNGWFVVQTPSGGNYLTRNGAFTEDSSGYLRTSDGAYLMGTTGATAPTSPTTGFPAGKLQIPATTSTNSPVVSFSVDPTGALTVAGQDGSTQVVGYIAVAQYNNNQALQDDGGGLYSYVPAAGTNQYYTGGDSGAATVQSGALEASNVDLSQEFSNMILAQTAFSANARVITVSDSILQTTTNLKQQ